MKITSTGYWRDWEPFRIVAKNTTGALPRFDTTIQSTIDGRQLNNGIIALTADKASNKVEDCEWVDEQCGNLYEMNYKFSPILFIEDGPLPREHLFYGSIVVVLEAGHGEESFTRKTKSTGKKPLGILDKAIQDQTTDAFVDGKVAGLAPPTEDRYPYTRNMAIPTATVVFKYGTRAMLVKNGILPSVTATSARPHPYHKRVAVKTGPVRGLTKSSYGGKEFKANPNPLTVIYDPEDDDGISPSNLQDILIDVNFTIEDSSSSSDNAASDEDSDSELE
ncbi:uncharacterized protein LOC62_04G006528 [Vanrija pseudolonga]|uniref:Uncharacterized protein n=1 Tax=Vanrija pseudolonga TaxID=143232 RepID=A0AAF0YFV3_9TREE|nr:hypothetical protein LOC62_04G006528 [Vanrija pseudolonga]